jgi:hypothetical protein
MIAVTRILIPALLLVLLIGCSKREEKKVGENVPMSDHATAKKEAMVVVPDSVKGKWKAVKIAVANKESNKETVYTVAIGSEITIPNSGLSLKVENFLPHFMMEGTTLTSQSNEPKNPAVQVRIMEGGKEIFKGWLYSLYPTTHAFQHPKYGFTLVDFLPAR